MSTPNDKTSQPNPSKKKNRTSEAPNPSLLVEEGQSEPDSEGPLELDANHKEIKLPKKSTRPKKPTEKAKAYVSPLPIPFQH